MKKCLLVLGMHRSGTSALAGTLSKIGIDAGYDFIDTLPENEKGFFENREINHLNIAILKHFGVEWYDVKNVWDIKTLNVAYELFGQNIKTIIDNHFGNSNLFLLKEPRMSLILPVYFKVFEEMNIDCRLINMERDDWEVAQSLKKRNNLRNIHSLTLAKFYKYCIKKNTREKSLLRISYESFLNDPFVIIKNIIRHCELNFDISEKQMKNINDFLDPGLKHNSRNGVLSFLLFKERLLKSTSFLLVLYVILFKGSIPFSTSHAKNL